MPEITETSEEIQQTIKQLQTKLEAKQISEDGEDVEKIELPVGDVDILVGGKNTVRLKGVTPPEVAMLVAEHHTKAGRMPIDNIVLHNKILVDPRAVRAKLVAKFGGKKVNAMFPGAIPTFPKSFRSAMSSGLATNLPQERLMDFAVEPMTA